MSTKQAMVELACRWQQQGFERHYQRKSVARKFTYAASSCSILVYCEPVDRVGKMPCRARNLGAIGGRNDVPKGGESR